ncbi:hypothetical protein A2526_01040 [candidate division WOR-1 bacterium RIFOXYD2_FULL_36_8]|uniref:Uncharacterized protein n=1 Tax=candidate division WOR-1 bacterium RIFOXYB2_FULL_36_35 TaxID=1802578 RepID=A0A1F4S2U7_UNCSA|nr:MAG: hypothetical protein A2230_07660 [candidate division WOR-1 bacterium RIFOXYA2_FULL_36_21]OGC14738.1 MAG: hypothetical protein A2290_08585 [candidate division WOR-1 bacterium RIFOXYB2_FULL_36_35]OGC15478.1 MAG: hypothetical protein A2282_07835 [candidate division WOR-1 bacterium RIFOXYA12_FULL_36_13]OGC38041.1 MAG: hypothetical protein A2526_01040 [candidate division WOR-1 bacterium RIFOXYD2_FULL_36_8]
MKTKSLYFFWDYDLSEKEVVNILKTGNKTEKNWIIARILEYAKWDDIWKYLSLNQIKEALPSLKINPKFKNIWQYAVNRWTNAN